MNKATPDAVFDFRIPVREPCYAVDCGIDLGPELIAESSPLAVIVSCRSIEVHYRSCMELDPHATWPPVRAMNSPWLMVRDLPDSISASRSIAVSIPWLS